MPKYVYVSKANAAWLQKALESIVGGAVSGTVATVTAYLVSKGISHGHADKLEHIPDGHTYHEG